MPLIDVAAVLAGDDSPPDFTGISELQVIVYRDGAKSHGLVVDRILDIAHESVSLSAAAPERSLLGTAVLQGVATDLLDPQAIVAKAAAQVPGRRTAA